MTTQISIAEFCWPREERIWLTGSIESEYIAHSHLQLSILTWHRRHRDPSGGSSRVRPFHCTSVGLTFAITPNVGDSGAQFLLVGDCVRAIP